MTSPRNGLDPDTVSPPFPVWSTCSPDAAGRHEPAPCFSRPVYALMGLAKGTQGRISVLDRCPGGFEAGNPASEPCAGRCEE